MSPSMSLVRSKQGALLALLPLLLLGCKPAAKEEPAAAAVPEDPAAVHPEIWPSPKWPFAKDEALEAKVAALLNKMTVEEKVGQVIQGERWPWSSAYVSYFLPFDKTFAKLDSG